MVKMASGILFVAILGAYFINAATASNVTSCYICQSPWQKECDDEFDIVTGQPYNCDSLSYSRASSPVPDLIQGVIRSERITNTTSIQYFCIKVGVAYINGTSGISRTCYKQPDNVADPCEFIRQEVVNGTVTSCDFCAEDRCNSSTGIYASMFMIFLSFLVAKN